MCIVHDILRYNLIMCIVHDMHMICLIWYTILRGGGGEGGVFEFYGKGMVRDVRVEGCHFLP